MLCTTHFEPHLFWGGSERRRLRPGAVPSKFDRPVRIDILLLSERMWMYMTTQQQQCSRFAKAVTGNPVHHIA